MQLDIWITQTITVHWWQILSIKKRTKWNLHTLYVIYTKFYYVEQPTLTVHYAAYRHRLLLLENFSLQQHAHTCTSLIFYVRKACSCQQTNK